MKKIIQIIKDQIPDSSLYKIELDNNKKSRIKPLTIIFLFLNLLVIYSLVVLYFCLMGFEEIKACYLNSYYSTYLIIITVITIMKVIISVYLSYILFRKWLIMEKVHIIEIRFLLGLFFYLFTIGKLIDLIMALIYVNPKTSSDIDLINLVKFRYIFAMLNVLPLYILGLYLYIYRRNLDKSSIEIRKIIRNNTVTFLTIYLGFWIIILNFLNNYLYIRFIMLGISVSFFFISWIFFEAHRGKILKNINCLVISIGFFLYTLSQITLPFSALILISLIVDGEIISVVIMEIWSLISLIIILIGFRIKVFY